MMTDNDGNHTFPRGGSGNGSTTAAKATMLLLPAIAIASVGKLKQQIRETLKKRRILHGPELQQEC